MGPLPVCTTCGLDVSWCRCPLTPVSARSVSGWVVDGPNDPLLTRCYLTLRRWLVAQPAAISDSVATAERIALRLHQDDCTCNPPKTDPGGCCAIDKANCRDCLTREIAAAIDAERRARETLEDAVLAWDDALRADGPMDAHSFSERMKAKSDGAKRIREHAARIRAARAGDGGGDGE